MIVLFSEGELNTLSPHDIYHWVQSSSFYHVLYVQSTLNFCTYTHTCFCEYILTVDTLHSLQQQCSSTCAGGFQRRVVVCQDENGYPANSCEDRSRPNEQRSCESGPCPQWIFGNWGEVRQNVQFAAVCIMLQLIMALWLILVSFTETKVWTLGYSFLLNNYFYKCTGFIGQRFEKIEMLGL